MTEERLNKSIEKKIAELAKKNIKADAAHLVETIKRQFSNINEYVRELVVNGIDAGATRVDVRADIVEEDGIHYARMRIIDNGRGMSFKDIQSYLTVFESCKDGTRQAVGKHGVGKLSPWAQNDLAGYSVITRDGKERTELLMRSVRDGEIRRYIDRGERGTTAQLLWKSEKPQSTLNEKFADAQRILKKYCRYAASKIRIDALPGDAEHYILSPLTAAPHVDGWRSLGNRSISGTPANIYYRFGSDYGLHLYQGGIYVTCKTDAFDGNWPLRRLEIMVDSHAFHLPISRNDVILDDCYTAVQKQIVYETVPAIMKDVCVFARYTHQFDCRLETADAEKLIVQYLLINPDFSPAQHLPLFPVLPFGLVSIEKIRSARKRTGGLMACTCSPDDFAGIHGHELVLDENRLESDMKDLLKAHFGPLQEVTYSNEAIEGVDMAGGGGLSTLELRFQESLALLNGGFAQENENLIETTIKQYLMGKINRPGLGLTSIGSGFSEYGPRTNPDLPDIHFRVTRLTRLDGKTPVCGIKFQIKGNVVLINLNNEDIRSHLAFAKKDPDLAAHWCLRELILVDRLSCFKHLSYETCETLVHSDAVARLGQPEVKTTGARKRRTQEEPNYWNDDDDDWMRLLNE